ncbi:MAG TPA: hypothetical protein VFH45_12915 [Acidimicrobiales bacterium]|nr:hypothetical protein [Acidimicrobiales bacterium]
MAVQQTANVLPAVPALTLPLATNPDAGLLLSAAPGITGGPGGGTGIGQGAPAAPGAPSTPGGQPALPGGATTTGAGGNPVAQVGAVATLNPAPVTVTATAGTAGTAAAVNGQPLVPSGTGQAKPQDPPAGNAPAASVTLQTQATGTTTITVP